MLLGSFPLAFYFQICPIPLGPMTIFTCYPVSIHLSDKKHSDVRTGFLQLPDYFSGILFLTTTNQNLIGGQFLSRIHIKICYPRLDEDCKWRIWANFLRPFMSEYEVESCLDVLASLQLDGREIRSLVTQVSSLAAANGNRMTLRDIHREMQLGAARG